MQSPAANVELHETELELTLLGSLFINDDAMPLFGDTINPEWFSDPLAQYLFGAAMRVMEAGNRTSPPAIMAALPETLAPGITRGQFYARCCAAGLPTYNVPALIATLKERWARRTLLAMAQDVADAAVRFDASPYEIASDAAVTLDSVAQVRAEDASRSLGGAAAALFDRLDSGAELRGATTGLRLLDHKLNGYKRGQLYVIAGRPGMGKSAFMCSSLWRTAAAGHGVMIVSLEMTDEEIAARILSDACDSTGAPRFGDIMRNQIDAAGREKLVRARQLVDGLPIKVDASARLTVAEIAARARRFKLELEAQGKHLDVLCIDHMGLITPTERYAGNKVAEASDISNRLRALAKELDCCVVLLSQLSREVEKREDKRPTLSDLRWSGEIEQDAHVVAFLFREAYYLEQDPDADPDKLVDCRWRLDLLIRKNRQGNTGDVRLWCSIAHSSLRDPV